MNIFLDESGSFVSASKPDSWNSIAAYMSPECDRRYIEKILAGIRRSVGNIMTAEIKLKHLNELQYFKFLKQLASLNGVVFAVATDAGMNLPNDILEMCIRDRLCAVGSIGRAGWGLRSNRRNGNGID